MPFHQLKDIFPQLKLVYKDQWEQVARQLLTLIDEHPTIVNDIKTLDQSDIMMITYGDSVFQHTCPPLKTLHSFYNEFASTTFSAIHILPFFPWTSDDGFSVINYNQVDPTLGDWNHIEALSNDCDLMFDAVVNHISKSSSWFQRYLAGNSDVENYFIAVDPELDHSSVVRPRNLPLLTPFMTAKGEKHVWTTFSDDQVDLNYAEPEVLIAVINVLIDYAQRGSRYIRLDAIGFLWKELGTTCIHLPQTHALIQVMRKVLDIIVPGVLLITETNVPHVENISYFGDGTNEAHLVYQFPLPPLMVHTLLTGNSDIITAWASTLEAPSDSTTFLNFLASHDGIGVRPATGLLSPEDIDRLQKHTADQHGNVSFKDNGDGTQSPYELNITFFDAISHADLDAQTNQKRMLVAHSILLALQGLPAIYIHNFVGSHNDVDGVIDSGIYRRINREKLDLDALSVELNNEASERSIIHSGIETLAKARKNEALFSPHVPQRVLSWSSQLVVIERADNGSTVTCIANISNETVAINLCKGINLVNGHQVEVNEILPYQFIWLKNE